MLRVVLESNAIRDCHYCLPALQCPPESQKHAQVHYLLINLHRSKTRDSLGRPRDSLSLPWNGVEHMWSPWSPPCFPSMLHGWSHSKHRHDFATGLRVAPSIMAHSGNINKITLAASSCRMIHTDGRLMPDLDAHTSV